jgi:hypothetical protein
MINKLIELNKKEVSAVSGGMSDFEKSIEDTLCSSSIYGAAVAATSLACPFVLTPPGCAAVNAVMLGAAFIVIPTIGEISKIIGAKNQTDTSNTTN